MFLPSSAMYHTIFPPTKTKDKTDSPPHPNDADNDGADSNNADNYAADDDGDKDADNAAKMQTTTTMTQPQTTPP
jgi:hypothetical protein